MSGAFDDLPAAGVVLRRYALGWFALVASLSLIGLIVTHVGPFEPVRRWDESVNIALADSRSDGAIAWARRWSELGDTIPILVILGSTTIVLAACRAWRAMLFVPMAMLAEITTFLSVNYLVGRPRPNVERLGPLPGTYSFPSGHIAATLVCWFGCALLLFWFRRDGLARVVAVMAAVVTVGMGWARVYVGMHHPIDVVLGLAMGVAALALTMVALGRALGRGDQDVSSQHAGVSESRGDTVSA